MELKGSKTEKNLMEAFAGESQARNKYSYYASKAKKDGYEQIAAVFEETAGNEKEHAKIWFKELHGGSVPDTYTNLLDAAAGEHGEWTEMYKRMAKEAKQEGFKELAFKFNEVAKIEKEGKIFAKKAEKQWVCRNCGYVHSGKQAPEECPVCVHPQAYFEIFNEEF